VSNATARRVRVEAGVFKRPDGRLEIGWRDAQSKQRWRAIDGGIKAARSALAQEHAKRARGEAIAADPRLSFDTAADAWWDARAGRLRPATQSAYRAALKHLRAHFGRQRLATITAGDVAAYVASRDDLKGWTIKGHLTVLSAIYRYANRHLGVTTPNPVAALDSVERPKMDDAKPKRILIGDELARLIDAVSTCHRLIFRVAAETGCRLGEALGLAWEDVNIAGQTITFAYQLDRHGKRVPLKTARSRRVLEVTPALAGEFRKHKLASVDTSPGALVFVRSTGRGHDHRNVGGRVLAKAVERAELAAPAPTFHDLRHTHASALIAQGWDIESVSARLGHADITTTQRIYVHEFDAANRSDERRAKLAALYGSAMEASARNRTKQTDPMSTNDAPVFRDVEARRSA
jgi:integrase